MKLPFLQNSKWPISKEPEERVANPSYDTQLQDHLIDEFLLALEKKDPVQLREAIKALIYSIQDEDSNAIDEG